MGKKRNLKDIFVALVLLVSLFLPSLSFADQWVDGYFRSNGTWVNGYYRSDPDGDPYNNYSFPGNYNLHTGKVAPGNPDTYLWNYYNKDSDDYYSPSYDYSYEYSYLSPNVDDSYDYSYSSSDYNSYDSDGLGYEKNKQF